MTPFYLLLCLFFYIFIGSLVAGIESGITKRDVDLSILWLWPLFIIIYIVVGVFWLPYKVGQLIGNLLHGK